MRRWIFVLLALLPLGLATPTLGDYERAGWVAEMPIGGAGSRGIATILDERTIRVHALYYNGQAPLVYFFLGATDTYLDFLNGQVIGPALEGMANECMIVQLPEGQTLDEYGAISIWCAALDILFTSAAFEPVTCSPDLDGDGAVGVDDLLEVISNWGEECGRADITRDALVGVDDLLEVVVGWGDCTD
ncbi:MAG: DM13 domain-containing protein [Planctomycetota bacterium]